MSEMPEERRIGVYICHCGGNISDYVDVAAVRDALKDDPGVIVAETTMFACSDGTQHDMINDIQKQGLDGLVVASCSPKLHQITFREVAKRADMNPYAYTQVNIREQDSWVHGDDPVGATEKAIGLVRAGIAKSRNSSNLVPLVVETTSATMVVGGGIAGLRAAIGLADVGMHVYLVERESTLGGWVGTFGAMFPNDQVGRDQIAHLVDEVAKRPAITVFTKAELVGKSGSFGNYVAEVRVNEDVPETLRATVGSIVIATGFRLVRTGGRRVRLWDRRGPDPAGVQGDGRLLGRHAHARWQTGQDDRVHLLRRQSPARRRKRVLLQVLLRGLVPREHPGVAA